METETSAAGENTWFDTSQGWHRGHSTDRLYFGDFDGDGKVDVLAYWTDVTSAGAIVHMNEGLGVYNRANQWTHTVTTDLPDHLAALCDFSGDGLPVWPPYIKRAVWPGVNL